MTEEINKKLDQVIETNQSQKFHKEMGEAQTKVDFGIKESIGQIFKKGEKPKVSMSGDVLFKDVQTFIPELIINVFLLVFGVLGIVLVRLLSQGFLTDFQTKVSEQSFNVVAEHVLFLHNVTTIGIAIPIVFMLSIFMFKWYFFYPRGKKQIVLRAWKMGVARIGLEEIKDNYVKFDNKKELSDEMHINYSNKSIDYYTGRPIILLQEGMSENSALHQNIKTNEKVKDRGNVNASMFSAALKFCDYQNKKAAGFFQNPTNILLIAVIVIVVVIAFFVMTGGSPTTALQGVATAATQRG